MHGICGMSHYHCDDSNTSHLQYDTQIWHVSLITTTTTTTNTGKYNAIDIIM